MKNVQNQPEKIKWSTWMPIKFFYNTEVLEVLEVVTKVRKNVNI